MEIRTDKINTVTIQSRHAITCDSNTLAQSQLSLLTLDKIQVIFFQFNLTERET